MDQKFRVAIRGIIGAASIAFVTILLLILLAYEIPPAMWSKWHTVISLLGSVASMGVILWGVLAQRRLE